MPLGSTFAMGYRSPVAGRKRVGVVKAAIGIEVVVGEAELGHAMRHFTLPRDLVFALITRVLREPTLVLADQIQAPRQYRMFYRLEDGRYLLAVVKVTGRGAFFAYPTGRRIRPSHARFRQVFP